MPRQFQISRLALGLFCGLLTAGCIAPIPTKERIQSPTAMKGKPVDISFIMPGSTTRQQVLERLAWADAGLNSQRLFLARWQTSRVILVWAVTTAPVEGGAGATTLWRNRNLMVQFDTNGTVESLRPVTDVDLASQLSGWIADNRELPLDLSKPVTVLAIAWPSGPSQITLGKDLFEFHGPHERGGFPILAQANAPKQSNRLGKSHEGFRVPPQEITRIHSLAGEDPAYVRLKIEFANGSAAGKPLDLQMRPSDLLTLLQYLHQTQAPSGTSGPS
jgi:hypothetical protein